jgi:predicted AAA+ superfamily ATPase
VPLLDRLAAHGVAAFALPDSPPSLNGYISLALRGGFPESVLASSERLRRRWLRAYVPQLITRDAEMVEGAKPPTQRQ